MKKDSENASPPVAPAPKNEAIDASVSSQTSAKSSPTANAPADAQLDELTILRVKCSEYENDLKRLQAEFDNYRKRVAKEKQQARLDGQVDAFLQFLSFQDEMESALSHLKKGHPTAGATHSPSSDAHELQKGVELLHRKLVSIFKLADVTEIADKGVADPHFHDVLQRVPGTPEGHIAHVLRKGYRLGDQVLRAAQVSVYDGQMQGKDNETQEPREEKKSE